MRSLMFSFKLRFTLLLIVATACSVAQVLRADTQLGLSGLGTATQTGGALVARPPGNAIDGSTSTYSETPDETNSFWEIEFVRKVQITRVELVAPPSAAANGLVLRISDLRDRTLFQAVVSGVAANGTWSTNLPSPINGRIVRFGLENGQVNGIGDRRTMLAEVRVYGDPSPAYGPATLGAVGSVSQTSTNLAPSLAVDNSTATYSETLDLPNSYWIMTFDRSRAVGSVEIVNRPDAANAARLQGLTLHILNDSSNSIASAVVQNPGASNSWTFVSPPGTSGRYVKIGLENGAVNGQGNRIVSLAEVNVFSSSNYAAGADSFMTRSTDNLLPTANVNDGNFSTYVVTKSTTSGGYYEIDFNQVRALYSVRAIAADGFQTAATRTTLSLFDTNHSLVYTQHLSGSSAVFDLPLPAPVFARFVKIGLEFNESKASMGFKEIQAFGRPTNEVGLLNFTASSTQIVSGAATTLNWQESELYRLDLYPSRVSVGSNTLSSGLGSRTVTLTNSTEYILVGSNFNGNVFQHLTINVNNSNLPVRISEFVASSKYSYRDGNKNFSDWIEIHNPNNTAVNLAGYRLSDNPALPAKWAFPPGTILPPHGYLVVFADDSNQPFDPAGFLHANFSLNADGESIILTASNSIVIDAITNYPPQSEDLAYGRTLEGVWTFIEPTPAAPNLATTYEGWLSPVDFDHKRGWYTNAFSLAISNSNPSSQVYWSTNGSIPTNLYTGPLTIGNTLPVRAQVVRAGYKSPRIKTHTYLFLDGIMAQPAMDIAYTQSALYMDRLRQGLLDLPTVCISVPGSSTSGSNGERREREASVEIFLPDGSDPVQANCGITHFGGTAGTTGNPYAKKSWQLKFRSGYGASKLNLPLFQGFGRGITPKNSFDEIDLHAGNHDIQMRGFYMSHRWAADTMLDMGSLNPHGRFVHVYTNGVYMGQFDAHERLTDAFLAEYLGGATEDYLTVKGNENGLNNEFVLGVPDPPDRAPWEIARANRSNYMVLKEWVDITNLIDFMLVWNWGNAEAEFRAAGAKASGTGYGGFKFWIADADGLLRNAAGINSLLNNAHNNSADGSPIAGPGWMHRALLAEGHPDFKTLLADRIYKGFFNGGPLTGPANEARMNLRMAEITNSMVAECARWGTVMNRTPVNWQSDAQAARDNLFPYRSDNLVQIFRQHGWYPSTDVPTLSQFGGSVSNGYALTITAGAGTIYYTLDGSDPRLPGGGISPAALVWMGGPLIVSSNVTVKVRLKNGSEWSAIGDASFVVAPLRQPVPGDLLITEINYNPPGSDDFEFIEIYNSSSNLLDLTNVRLVDGLDFLFPNNFYLAPGAFALVVENSLAFDQRYRTPSSPYYYPGLRIAGTWTGQLSNSGERIALLASNNVSLAEVNYQTGGAWPGRADSVGSSLELRNYAAAGSTNVAVLNAHLARGANWRSSPLYHGSPGRFDTLPREIVINEVVAHTDIGVDWIELKNTSASAVTLTNWYLSDHYDQPFRYSFPADTTIPPGGFLILHTNELGFGFSELGSDILLVQAPGTNILRFVDTVDISAVAREEPFGRYTRSDGVVDFTELRAKTQGVDNALPRVGPVVFSEIMYHPTNGLAEYVELVNLTPTNVPLYDIGRPTNRWMLSGGVDFTFPAAQLLAPGAVVIVCATNPEVFRAQYGVSPSLAVYGPWTNVLNNAGESIKLLRPGDPEPNGFVPYYRVDHARYESVAPWPEAAKQGGISLSRITLPGYGNDPANWEPSVPGGNPGIVAPNHPPTLLLDGEDTIVEGDVAALNLNAGDLDAPWQSLVLSAQNLPPGSTLDPTNGTFTWVTGEADGPGTYDVKFVVTDNGLPSLSVTQTVALTVLESNLAPSLTLISSFHYPALTPFALDVVANDLDLPPQTLSYSAVGLPAGLGINAGTGRISGAAEGEGAFPVSVFVGDDQTPSLRATNTFTLTVTHPFIVEVAPTMVSGQSQFRFWAVAGGNYDVEYTMTLSPPDWQVLQRLTNSPGGLQIIPTPPTAPQCWVRVLWRR